MFALHKTGIVKFYKKEAVKNKSGNNIDIDCGCAFGERLACLRLNDMREFYVKC